MLQSLNRSWDNSRGRETLKQIDNEERQEHSLGRYVPSATSMVPALQIYCIIQSTRSKLPGSTEDLYFTSPAEMKEALRNRKHALALSLIDFNNAFLFLGSQEKKHGGK